ncbi:MAG TPA: hypothetical protein DEG43_16710 [Acidimicrobiaceae bacterium]|nr:hypothetical protein [Acidimicrobiaceae bacterium]
MPATIRTGSPSSPRSGSPDKPSPTRAIFPPDRPRVAHASWRTFIAKLLARLNPTRSRRSNPRVVKRKYTRWHVKRAHHDHWPQPTHQTTYTPAALT